MAPLREGWGRGARAETFEPAAGLDAGVSPAVGGRRYERSAAAHPRHRARSVFRPRSPPPPRLSTMNPYPIFGRDGGAFGFNVTGTRKKTTYTPNAQTAANGASRRDSNEAAACSKYNPEGGANR